MERPPRVISTVRFTLRIWDERDGDAHYAASCDNREHLRQWEGWAQAEPSLSTSQQWVEWCGHLYAMGRGFVYGMFDPDARAVLGSAGLHPVAGRPDWSVGYWTDARHLRRGYATDAAAILTSTAFELGATAEAEIHCNEANTASAAIPRRLGYELTDITDAPAQAPLQVDRWMRWTLTRPAFEASEARGRALSLLV